MGRGAWPATIHGAANSWTQLSDWAVHVHMVSLVGSMASKFGTLFSNTFASCLALRSFPHGSSSKESSACNAGDTGDVGLIPKLGRSPGGGCGNHSSILAWKIPWAKEPGGLQPIGLQSWIRMSMRIRVQTFDLRRLACSLSHWRPLLEFCKPTDGPLHDTAVSGFVHSKPNRWGESGCREENHF